MGGSYHTGMGLVKKHGQAISHHDGAGQSALGAPTSIRLWCFILGRVINTNQLCAMHLSHKHGPDAPCMGHTAPIFGDFGGVIAHMITQIQALVGANRNTALTGTAIQAGAWPIR
jgi:hypothetical protein